MNTKHQQKVEQTAAIISKFFTLKQPFRIYHGSTNSTRILSFKKDQMINMSTFTRVLSVDTKKQIATVEPNVPMDKLVRATLKYGLIPPVVMEFPGITVGGGIQGGAGESSSFKWGCFNQTCTWYEMILPNGDVTTAFPTKNGDLFYGTAGSFGTLGVITAAKIKLIPAKKYVNLTYIPVTSFKQSVTAITDAAKQKPDYIDGIMFSKDSGVIMVGELSDTPVSKPIRFTRARDQWFYLHAEEILKNNREEPYTESIPLVDYLFRYDRGAFWVGRFAFDMFDVAFTRFYRWLLNPILHTRQLYEALQESGASQRHVVQDLALPKKTAVQFMEFVDQNLGTYPLWLCPLKPDSRSPFQSNNLKTPMVINIGVWGAALPSHPAFLKANRAIEKELFELGGKKWFYAHSYYTKKEFWTIYNKKTYDSLRRKYHAESLPTVYDKVTVKEQFPIDLKRGVWRTIFRRAKLRITS